MTKSLSKIPVLTTIYAFVTTFGVTYGLFISESAIGGGHNLFMLPWSMIFDIGDYLIFTFVPVHLLTVSLLYFIDKKIQKKYFNSNALQHYWGELYFVAAAGYIVLTTLFCYHRLMCNGAFCSNLGFGTLMPGAFLLMLVEDLPGAPINTMVAGAILNLFLLWLLLFPIRRLFARIIRRKD